MGNFNSGRRSGRPTVDAGLTLTLKRLLDNGTLQPGAATAGSIHWSYTRSGEGCGSVSYRADLTGGDAGTLFLRYAKDGTPQAITVTLTTTPCRYGGRRWWFVCPATGRRCLTLHLPPGGTIFAARQAYRLAYRSQREGSMERSHARQGRLYRRLGQDYRYFEQPPPPRPKGMRRATYQGLIAQLEGAMEQHEDIFATGAARILAREKRR